MALYPGGLNRIRDFLRSTVASLITSVAPVAGALTLGSTIFVKGTSFNVAIGGKSVGNTVTASSSDGTALTVTGTTLSGTFANAGGASIMLTETAPNGVSATSTIPVRIAFSKLADLQAFVGTDMTLAWDASDDTSLVSSSGSITAFVDKVQGYSRPASGSLTTLANDLNGRRSVRITAGAFFGSIGVETLPSFVPTADTPCSVWSLSANDNTSNITNPLLAWGGATNPLSRMISKQLNMTLPRLVNRVAAASLFSTPVWSGAAVLAAHHYRVTQADATVQHYASSEVNGVATAPLAIATPATASTTARFRIGGDVNNTTPTNTMDGRVALLIVTTPINVMSADKQQAVRDFLSATIPAVGTGGGGSSGSTTITMFGDDTVFGDASIFGDA